MNSEAEKLLPEGLEMISDHANVWPLSSAAKLNFVFFSQECQTA